MASNIMVLFFCCIALYDVFVSYQYRKSMRQLLLSVHPSADETHATSKYPRNLIHTSSEATSQYDNRIGSPVNQLYYYDSSRQPETNGVIHSSDANPAAAMIPNQTMNDQIDNDDQNNDNLSSTNVEEKRKVRVQMFNDANDEEVHGEK
jgi:hypothetical protein